MHDFIHRAAEKRLDKVTVAVCAHDNEIALLLASRVQDHLGRMAFMKKDLASHPPFGKHLLGICEMLSGFYGRTFTADDYLALGRATLKREREFNEAAGFTAADDRLPDYFKTEKLAPHDTTFTVPDEQLDEVFQFTKP